MSEGFETGAAYSVFEALRAGPGETLDRLAIGTYSLDLVAFAALMLSLGGAGEEELDAGPLRLLDALENIAPRIDVVHQKDRLRAAKRHHQILHLLDGRLHAVQPPPGASYHPKLALARYIGAGGRSSWRLWIGSRNMTAGEDREAGLLLCGSLAGKQGSKLPDMATMARELLAPVTWVAERASELAQVRWRAPAGTRLRSIQWRREGQLRVFDFSMPRGTRTLAISPFVDPQGCAIGLAGSGERCLLTTVPAAAELGALEGVVVHVAGTPRLDVEYMLDADHDSAAEAPEAPIAVGIHAKLLLRESDSRARLWVGSANLTKRGLEGPNAELVAELDIPTTTARVLRDFATCQPLPAPHAADPAAAAARTAERALDAALLALLKAELTLSLTPNGLILSTSADLSGLLARHRLRCWLFTRPSEQVEWARGSQSIVVMQSPPPPRMQTVLVCFEVAPLDGSCKPRSWAQKVDYYPGFDSAARDLAAKAAYARMAGASAWLRGQLEGILPAEPLSWSTAERRRGRGEAAQATSGLPLAIEEVLAAWARNPEAFEAKVERIDTMLVALGVEIATAPVEDDAEARADWESIEKLWREIRGSLELD